MVMHWEAALEGKTPSGKCVGIARGAFGEDPDMPVLRINKLFVIKGPRRQDDEVLVDEEVLDFGVWHDTILSSEGGSFADDPIVLVQIVPVAEYNFKVVIESESVDGEAIHIHADFKEGTNFDSLVRSQPELIESLAIGQYVHESIIYCKVCDGQC